MHTSCVQIGSVIYSPLAANLEEWASKIGDFIVQMQSFPDTVDFSSYLLQLRLTARRAARRTVNCIELFEKYLRAFNNLDTYLDYEDDVDLSVLYEDFLVQE